MKKIILLAAVACLATSPVHAQLTVEKQLAAIDANFVCPENLPDAAARQKSLSDFLTSVSRVQVHVTPRELVAYRSKLLRKHRCYATLEKINRSTNP